MEKGNTRLVVFSVEMQSEVCALRETKNRLVNINHTNRFIKLFLAVKN